MAALPDWYRKGFLDEWAWDLSTVLVRLGLFALRSLRHCTAAVFLTLIIFDLQPGLICSPSAAAKSQQADHSNQNKFHFCLPSRGFFLPLNISGGKTSKSGRKKIPALLLILKTM